jgi:hypothetical protein
VSTHYGKDSFVAAAAENVCGRRIVVWVPVTRQVVGAALHLVRVCAQGGLCKMNLQH